MKFTIPESSFSVLCMLFDYHEPDCRRAERILWKVREAVLEKRREGIRPAKILIFGVEAKERFE